MYRLAVGSALALSLCGCTPRALEIPSDAAPDLTLVDLAGADLTDLAHADLGDMPAINPCPAGTQFIFTISDDSTLSRFSPASNAFFDVGPISCPVSDPTDTPNSMAIDRSGNGYVNFQSGNIFRLLTQSATCATTAYVPGQDGITRVGMSFAENSPGSTDETLFITPTATATQASLSSVKVSKPISLDTTQDGELTGDDQANLWGFFPDAATPFIARINKTKGTFDRRLDLTTLAGTPQAWGFAAWQNDFYVFLERQDETATTVYHVDGMTGAVTVAEANTGRTIVGVGVATCAGNNGD